MPDFINLRYLYIPSLIRHICQNIFLDIVSKSIFWIIVILIIIVWLVTYSIHFFTSELISQVIKIFKNKKEDRETGDRSNQNVKNPQTQNSKNQVPVGKIIYADANNPELIYVNVGSAKGVKVGQTFDVLYSEEAEPLIDPDVDTDSLNGVLPENPKNQSFCPAKLRSHFWTFRV